MEPEEKARAVREYMSELGRRGGRSRSPKKVAAAKQTIKIAKAVQLRRKLAHEKP